MVLILQRIWIIFIATWIKTPSGRSASNVVTKSKSSTTMPSATLVLIITRGWEATSPCPFLGTSINHFYP